MRYWQNAGLIVVIVMLGVAASLDQSPSKEDGHDLLRKCLTGLRALDAQQWDGSTMTDFGWCMGYILGFVEGSGWMGADIRAHQPGAKVKEAFCPTGLALPVEHLARGLVEWLRTHPALLYMPRTAVTIAAFADTFPCPSSVAPPQEPTPSVVPRPPAPTASQRRQG
jgi:hypothetical protein